MDWLFVYIPLDSPVARKMLKEVIAPTGSVLNGKLGSSVGRKPGQRPEAQKSLRRRLERATIRADSRSAR
jgi:hypothetical protein